MPDLAKIEQTVQGILDQEAFELVDLRYLNDGGRWVLRFYVDKAGGVKLDDCEYLSNRIGAMLDITDLMPSRYTLEVSSPGMNRVLKKEKDFLRFQGHRVKLRLKSPEGGQRQFRGFLKPMEGNLVVLEAGEKTVRFAIDRIDEARLDPEIEI